MTADAGVIRARGASTVYADLGPADGHALVHGWLTAWTEAIAAARGVVYRIDGNQLLAAFYDPLAAFETALALAEADLPPPHPALSLALGADAGPCVALGPGVDYAGAPVERAIAAASYAAGGEIMLGSALASTSNGRSTPGNSK